MRDIRKLGFILTFGIVLTLNLFAQTENTEPAFPPPDFNAPPTGAPPGPPGFGPGFGPPGFNQELKILSKFDKDGDKRLNAEERKAAREYIKTQRNNSFGRRMPRGPFEFQQSKPQPGKKISPDDVEKYPSEPLYTTNIVRTIFLEFESSDWEQELEDFHNTDVEVPAKLIVDGKEYKDVGVHFRGMSSYMMVPTGFKRSLNISVDFVHKGQSVYGYRTLNLLNSHGDSSFIRSVLFFDIARHFIPAPKANFVRVVINGENWGIYINEEQINKDFVKTWFGTDKGARWKAPGRPNGNSGLSYLGDDIASYKRLYEIKSKDDPDSWKALVNLCKLLNTTPTNELHTALDTVLDIDGALKFLALDIAFINNDGYWVRASDYYLYLDPNGKFHVIPFDVNETFSTPGGPGFGGPGFGPRGFGRGGFRFGGVGTQEISLNLDPLYGLGDDSKPLRSRLLSNPLLQKRYLEIIKEIAEKWMDWERIGPIAKYYQNLIDQYVKEDTKKLSSYEEFANSIDGNLSNLQGRGFSKPITLKQFCEQRRKFLLEYVSRKLTEEKSARTNKPPATPDFSRESLKSS